jgi:hypothetical protein
LGDDYTERKEKFTAKSKTGKGEEAKKGIKGISKNFLA